MTLEMVESGGASECCSAFEQLVSRFYDAVLDAAHWETALGQLCDAFDSKGVLVLAQNRTTGKVPVALSYGIPEDAVLDYQAEVYRLDPLRRYALANPHRELIYEYLHTPEDAIDDSPYHHIMEQRSGIRYRVSAKLFDNNDTTAFVALQRTRDQGHPDKGFLGSFMRVVPHLARAVRIAHRLGDLELAASTSEQVLDDLPTGVCIIDADGEVDYLNRAAEAVIEANDALSVGPNGLFALRSSDDAALQRLLCRASNPARLEGGSLALTRSSGKRPYALQLVPVAAHQAVFSTLSPRVVVLISDPERSTATPDEWLQRLFGLTSRQAQLANLLVEGQTLSEAAEAMGIVEKTARSHLENVLKKTGTRRQSELVALISALPAT